LIKNKNLFYWILIFITTLEINAQQVSEKSTYKVYNDLILAIGNTNPRAPDLVISTKSSKILGPASYSPKKRRIRIEKEVLEVCHEFNEDSLNVLAYILAHELSHHYKDHGFTSRFASLDFSDEVDEELEKIGRIKDNETQADVYAGFYAHMAGYNALSKAPLFLEKIYKKYNYPDNLPNYPTLTERKQIIIENKKIFEKLRYIYDIANISISIGKYDFAEKLLLHILQQDFTSREIYNNLGICYVNQALKLNLEGKYFNLIIPFKMDISSRLQEPILTRGDMTDKDYAILLLKRAANEFNTALRLDPSYSIAKENLFYSRICLNYLGEETDLNIYNELINDPNCNQYCLNGQFAAFNNKLNKAKSYFKKGAKDGCNICKINIDFKKKQKQLIKKTEITDLDLLDTMVNEIPMNCLDIDKRNQNLLFYERINRLEISVEEVNNIKLIKLRDKINRQISCLAIQEYSMNEKIYTDSSDLFPIVLNNVDIYIGDSEEKILKNHNNLRVVETGSSKYISIINENITFFILEGKVHKWYYNLIYN